MYIAPTSDYYRSLSIAKLLDMIVHEFVGVLSVNESNQCNIAQISIYKHRRTEMMACGKVVPDLADEESSVVPIYLPIRDVEFRIAGEIG